MREDVIRRQLISTLEGKGSHIPFTTAIHKFPVVLAGHNSYHIGQLIAIRQLLGVPVRDW